MPHGKEMDRSLYDALYAESLKDPEGFWGRQAQRLEWIKPWKRVKDVSFTSPVRIRWFEGGVLNVSVNCLDRHLPARGDKVAYYWEGDDPTQTARITYRELHEMTCRMANVLKDRGVKKGDRVTIYLPMIPEAAAAMLACARIGAVHSVVFGGFSAEALASRVIDCGSEVVITADAGFRGGKPVPLKRNVDTAIQDHGLSVRHVLVVRHAGGDVAWDDTRDVWLDEAMGRVSPQCDPEPMDAEDPLFILYTSGSTGKPKGVLHTTGGYLLYASFTHAVVFGLQEDDLYWCTADVGWVTGHSYVVYGPLANGASCVMFEGVPSYPDWSRCWEIVHRLGVTIFYTAPTAIRAKMREGDEPVKKYSRHSLRLLGTVGEPINPEAWRWYNEVVGEKRCPIVDTWWQTETGATMMTPIPGAHTPKPGAASFPFFGVRPLLLDPSGAVMMGPGEGYLVIADGWPGQARTVWGDHSRFESTYFSQYPGYYFTGDGARRDEDGYWWITGRVDDVINVSGHRMGTAEVESALVGHAAVAEAAVVGYPHDVKGQGIFAYVTLSEGHEPTESLRKELAGWVRREIGPIATPDVVIFAPQLPKTRSGKIMRRILRKVAEGETRDFGDTSTLTNPEIVELLVREARSAA